MELSYYPLAMATEKINWKEDFLICLAADGKLPIYVRLGGEKAYEFRLNDSGGLRYSS